MKKPKPKVELFVMVMLNTLDAPAWRALSHGAQILYIALKRRHRRDQNNNGSIFLSQRDAEAELGSSKRYVARWFRELEHYGFIVMTRAGFLGTEGKGKAPHWRLTELPCGDDPPTRDFMKWNGVRMTVRRKISRGTKVPHRRCPHMGYKSAPYLESSPSRLKGDTAGRGGEANPRRSGVAVTGTLRAAPRR